MAIDKVKLGYSATGSDFIEMQLDAKSVIASNSETAEQHILNTAKHVPATTTANNGKVLTTKSDGGIDWVAPKDSYTKTEEDTKVTDALNQAKSYADTKVANLVGTAPATLDTLQELAAAIQTEQTATAAINASITNKQDKVPATSNLLKGTNVAGGVAAAVPGTDYVVPSGNVATATKLAAAKTIGLSGGVTGTATGFDGSANITIPVTSVDATKLTGTIPTASIPSLDASKVNIKADICYVSAETEIASKNLKPGGLVLMKV